jgi:hypothetical protein
MSQFTYSKIKLNRHRKEPIYDPKAVIYVIANSQFDIYESDRFTFSGNAKARLAESMDLRESTGWTKYPKIS